MRIQGILIFLISAFSCYFEVVINISVLETQKGSDVEFWMLICHGMFGVGGLIGPILVYFFEVYSFAVMGVLIIAIAPAYYFLKTPEDHNKVEEQVSKEGLLEEIKNVGH